MDDITKIVGDEDPLPESESDNSHIGEPIPALSEEQVTTLARDIAMDKIYITQEFEGVLQTFPVIAFMEKIPANIGAIYEYYSEAGPVAVNGGPMFFSARFVPIENLDFLISEIKRFMEALGLV